MARTQVHATPSVGDMLVNMILATYVQWVASQLQCLRSCMDQGVCCQLTWLLKVY